MTCDKTYVTFILTYSACATSKELERVTVIVSNTPGKWCAASSRTCSIMCGSTCVTLHHCISTALCSVSFQHYPLSCQASLARVSVQGILHRDGKGCRTGRRAVIMPSTFASTRSIEAVVRVDSNGNQWYQLYWCAPSCTPQADAGTNRAYRFCSNDVTPSILSRIKAAAFTTLVITLDMFALGWR